MNNFDKISELLLIEAEKKFNDPNLLTCDIEFSDNFAELLEKLFILHCRMWALENKVAEAKNDEELAFVKRKIDWCFKDKRPKLIKVINLMLDNYIKQNKPFSEENVKDYKGFKN